MHLLIRAISAYSGPSILLGAFRTTDLAESARREYLATVMHGGSDPWADQENPSSSDQDLVVRSDLELIDCDAAIDRVFVVGAAFYGMGQILRGFLAVAGSEAAAAEHAAKFAAENANDDFFCGTAVLVVPLDTLSTERDGYPGENA